MGETIAVLKKEQDEHVVEVQEKAEKEKKRRRCMGKKGYNPQKKRACVDCIKKCIRTHGRVSQSSSSEMARPIPTPPSFFKIMVGYFSESMSIPPSFAKTILDLMDSNVYLEDTFGLRWRVRVCLRDAVLSFGHGWKNFVLDHAVSVGEFLVFRQIARSVFTVQIFAPSACERLYLCERNKRQSRKRKTRQKASAPGLQTVKIRKNNVDVCKKKLCTDPRNGPGLSNCDMPLRVCVNSEKPKAVSELHCCKTSQAPDVHAVGSHEAVEVPIRYQDKALEVSKDGAIETDCTIFMEKETKCNALTVEHPTYDANETKALESMAATGLTSDTEDMENLAVDANNSQACPDLSYSITRNMMMIDTESLHSHQDKPMQLHAAVELEDEHTETKNCVGSNLPSVTNADADGSLAVMDLNEVSMDDIFLSADMYEFDGNDLCNPEAFSVEPNMEGLSTNGQTSGFNCLENSTQNLNSSMEVGHCFVMLETLSCAENKEITDVPGTSIDAGHVTNVPMHDIDINAVPTNELSAFGEDNSFRETVAEVPSSECAFDSCDKDKNILLFPCEGSKVVKQEASSAKQDSQQDGPGQNVSEIMSDNPRPHELVELSEKTLQPGNASEGFQTESTEPGYVLAANHRKFCIAVPAPDQTWLELPTRLPVLPRTRKQGRKIVILKDPCLRQWPVLYQCSPKFNGFISGWEDITRENNLQQGDTCEFELCTNRELSFQVHVPRLP